VSFEGIRFDVNLSILFTEQPLLVRPAAAAAAGFDAVELWWPFPVPDPSDRELVALKRALDDAGTRLVGLNFDAGDMAAGWRGLLSLPDQSERFRANVPVAAGFAAETGCRVLNALYGNSPGDDELALENLAMAAEAARQADASVVIEALNSYESPRYPLTSTAAALRVVETARAAGHANVAFLCDFYDLVRMGEDLSSVIHEHADRIGHAQVADAPGRNQPGTGTIDFDRVLGQLRAAGYAGYVGCEYRPLGASAESFEWLPRELRASAAVGRAR
jgi:hydroxypyruvate isomerase